MTDRRERSGRSESKSPISCPSNGRTRAALRASLSVLAIATACAAAPVVVPTGPALAQQAAGVPVRGRVSDATGRIYLEGVIVRIPDLGLSTATGRDGSYGFRNVAPGRHRVIIDYVGAERAERTIDVVAGTPLTVDIALGAGGVVAPGRTMENIIVTGIRASSANALARQRASDNLIAALSADAIGNLPDQNVAEATRRLPGLSVENDQGEGRFIIVRGIDSNLNSTTINGLPVPSPQRDGRQVALDVIPSDLLSGVVVTKVWTPDMSGDAIGGNVEIETLSAFERDGLWYTLRAEGSYNELEDDLSPKLSGAFSNVFGGDRFGIAAAVSWFDRDFGSDNLEVDGGWSTTDNGFLFPVEPEHRNYIISRERFGAALNLDWRASESTDLYFRGLYSDFSDLEFRNRNEFRIRADDAADGSDTTVFFDDEVRIDRESKDRTQEQTILSLQIGGETRVDGWTFEYKAGFARAEEDEVDRIDTTFRRAFGQADSPDFLFGIDFTDAVTPSFFAANQATGDLINDASLYAADEFELTDNTVDDEEWSLRADVTRALFLAGTPGDIQFGVNVRLRDKDNDENLRVLEDFPLSGDGDPITAADFATTLEFALGDFGPAIDPRAVRAFIDPLRDQFEVDTFDSFAGDYSAQEDVYAGYVMARANWSQLAVGAGVRVEYTDFSSSGFLVGDTIAPISDGNDYTDVLPSLYARYEPTEQWVLRAAFSKTLSRPLIDRVVTRFSIDDDEAFIGNPELDPFESYNLDAIAEFYPTRQSVLSAGVFYKNIDNFIFDSDLAGQPGFEDFVAAIQAQNGDAADLIGFELIYQQDFTFLPSPFDGLILSASYTFTDGDATIEDVNAPGTFRDIPLPRQSKHLANLTVGYEKYGVEFRAAMAFRDRYLDVVNAEGFADRFVQDHLQWDLSAKYAITDWVQVYAEASNINDEPFHAVFTDPGLLAQFEEYGYSVAFGVRLTR